MPAPAVIPALIAYVKVVAVKTLVVGLRSSEARPGCLGLCLSGCAGYLETVGGGQVCSRLSFGSQGSVFSPHGRDRVRLGVPLTMTKLV